MFRIGEFSRIAKVTIDTLRHYDALDLLKPVKVDPFTGYRYYSARQLLTLNRIQALKEVGFSLDEIARVFHEDLTNDQLRGMLRAQLVRAESDMLSAQQRQERIQTRLHYLSLEDNMPEYEVTVKPGEALTLAAMREVVATIEQMPDRCAYMFDTIYRWLQSMKLPVGPTITIYYNEGFVRENVDTECAFIVPDAKALEQVRSGDGVTLRELEAAPFIASTIVTDDFYRKAGALLPAYSALAQWIEENGYEVMGPPREIFYGSPHTNDLTAEVQFPVDKA